MPDFLVEQLDTVEVEDGQGGAMVINRVDFDPQQHKLYGAPPAPATAAAVAAAPIEAAPTEAPPKRRRTAPAAAPEQKPAKRRRTAPAAAAEPISPEAAIAARVAELQTLYELKDGNGGPAAIEAIATLLDITKPKSGWRSAFAKIAKKELEIAKNAAADPTE